MTREETGHTHRDNNIRKKDTHGNKEGQLDRLAMALAELKARDARQGKISLASLLAYDNCHSKDNI